MIKHLLLPTLQSDPRQLLLRLALAILLASTSLSMRLDQARAQERGLISPSVQYLGSTIPIPDELDQAIHTALQTSPSLPSLYLWYVTTNVTNRGGGWWTVSVAGLTTPQGNVQDHGAWTGALLIDLNPITPALSRSAILRTPEGDALLPASPLEQSARASLSLPISRVPSANNQTLTTTNTYLYFPFETGKSLVFGPAGVHGKTGSDTVGRAAVDFLGSSSNDLNTTAPPIAYAAEHGSVIFVCKGAANWGIKIDGDTNTLSYYHLLPNSAQLAEGATFEQGQQIAGLVFGDLSDTCGYADQASNHFHLHFVFDHEGYLNIDHCTLNIASEEFVCSDGTQGINDVLTAQWQLPGGGGAGSYSGSNFWDFIVSGITYLMFQALGVLPSHQAINLPANLLAITGPMLEAIYWLILTNIDMRFPVASIFIVSAFEGFRTVVYIWLLIKQLMPPGIPS